MTAVADALGELSLRPFADADEAACRRIAVDAALSSYGPALPHARGHLVASRPLEDADARIVAVAKGVVVGFVELVGSHVSNLFVDPPLQGRGIGTTLLGEAERRIAGEVTLSVFAVNVAARRLYERLGFEEEGVAKIPFAGGDAVVVRMRKATARPGANPAP